MLGNPDPALRDGTGYPTLATWIERGVYDDLLTGLGDGMAAGLVVGLGERAPTPSSGAASPRWCWPSASTATTSDDLLPAGKVLEWGDRIATWLLRERDLRGYVPEQGLGARRRPRRRRHRRAGALDRTSVSHELTVLLDVIADRLLAPVDWRLHPRRARPAGVGHDGRAPPQRRPAPGPRAVDRPARRRGQGSLDVRRRRPVPWHAATPRRSSGRCTCSSPSAPGGPASARPAAGPGRRAALDQPDLPHLTPRSARSRR